MAENHNVLSSPLIPADLAPVISALCTVGVDLAGIIARGPLGQSLGHAVGENAGGDGQKALDVLADDMFEAALRETSVRWYASEEQEGVLALNPKGRYALAIDPLDGSSNIDVNVSIGTIFSIFEAKDEAEASFLRPASEQVAGGYIIFGPQCCLVVTFGDGTLMFALNPATQRFELVSEAMQTPAESREYAINASNHRHWDAPIRSYIEDCQAGNTGPHGQDSNMRWVASLVAEAHRILTRGGIFLYPGDARPGYEKGRLRMVYEVAPIAFLIEQAGGLATDGQAPIMELAADALHARMPLVFGSPAKVRQVAGYFDAAD
ncbi:MAG: class 1 fructose-bisphosphatase [Rhodobacterales bacterium]